MHLPTALPGDPQEAALAYAALGWRVIPIAPGFRYPKGIQRWQHVATDDHDIIANWYANMYRRFGVGIVTGAETGVWCVDVDVKDGMPGRASLEALQAECGELPATVSAITGTGGAHLFFTWDPEHPVSNFQEGLGGGDRTPLGRGLDIRGEGGFVVAAPTLHPEAGVLYRWAEGRDPWSCEVAPAPEWLYEKLERSRSTPEGRFSTGPTPLPDMPDTPGNADSNRFNNGQQDPSAADYVREREDFPSMLRADGWTLLADYGDQSRWKRPGKTTDGHSAILHNAGDGPLNIFSSEVDHRLFEVGTRSADGTTVSVSTFDYVAAMRHNGDKSAAAREARHEITERNRPSMIDIAEQMAEDAATTADPFAHFGAWRPVDLGKYLDGLWEPEPPTLLERSDGKALFYRQNVNWLHGAAGEGKTWVALVMVAQELLAGRHVIWVHYEDPEADKITHRLTMLGCPPGAILEFFHVVLVGAHSMQDGMPFLSALWHHFGADLIVIDSIGEAIGADGIAAKDDERLVMWIHATARELAGEGATVLGIDHLPMSEPTRLNPVGSFRKLAAVTGAAYLAQAPQAPSQGKAGYITLTCAKDRSGTWEKAAVCAVVHIKPGAHNSVVVDVVKPQADTEGPSEAREVLAARHVYRVIREHDRALTKAEVVAALAGLSFPRDVIRAGVDVALFRGWLINGEKRGAAETFLPGEQPPSMSETA